MAAPRRCRWRSSVELRSHTTASTCFVHLQPPKGVPYCHHEYCVIWYSQSIISTGDKSRYFLKLETSHYRSDTGNRPNSSRKKVVRLNQCLVSPYSIAVSLKLRKLWVQTENLKFCENEPSDPQFFASKHKYVDFIQNPLDFLAVKVW
jgi:hypothetical protein